MNPKPIFEQFSLKDRVVILTGGAGLLGRQYAWALAQAGACVVVADIDDAPARAVSAEVNHALPGHAFQIQVDVADKLSVAQMVPSVLKEFGRIDGLVNNASLDPKFDLASAAAASQQSNAFEDYPLELWNQALAVNLTGMFLCCQAVAPTMLAQKRGSIVNVSSIYGLVAPDQRLYQRDDPHAPRQYKPVYYPVTKSAVLGLTQYLAAYWGDRGIRVNTLTPGGAFNGHDDEFVRRYSLRTPLGRMADKAEFCGALLFLLSDASSYMTGANLVVDGGWTAW
jgi:NAD(P)-dependent dehydrogenase (short-subunit alcohol dehydrogenase family)